MGLDLTALHLERALEQSGCPICRVKSNSEMRYINWLLWENTYDAATRNHIIASLGYCHEHIWLAGLVEVEQSGSPTSNVAIYRHLASIVQRCLEHYLHRYKISRHTWWKRFFHQLLPFDIPRPQELLPREGCRVCETGQGAVSSSLHCLLSGLAHSDSSFRERYTSSEGMCLPHLRDALMLVNHNDEAGLEFLIENTLLRLAVLEHDLDEFNRKDT